MRTIVIHAPKDLRIEERDPTGPGPGEVQVRVSTGGVCGSDLHYYNHGGFGTVRLKEPMILGHEVSGRVAALGAGVTGPEEGDLVAISPSRPCGHCRYCQEGLRNQCLNMRFYGSAMPFPHIQGAFCELLTCDATQCVKANGLSAGEAALAEPFAVTLHATLRAGQVLGKRVLVTGCGPIGVLAITAARRGGAAEIVATDIAENGLAFARLAGADLALNTATDPNALAPYLPNKGTFDVLLECSGAEIALAQGIAAVRPKGIVVQVGMGGDVKIPMQQVTTKELELRGSFRFHEEFALAVGLMQSGLVDLKPLITHTLPLADALEAFETANDRRQAMKVQIAFD